MSLGDLSLRLIVAAVISRPVKCRRKFVAWRIVSFPSELSQLTRYSSYACDDVLISANVLLSESAKIV